MQCTCCGNMICTPCLKLTGIVIVTIFCALVAWKPKKTIDIQTALYRPFNWKLEPIDMEKEIRNTRIMGLIVVILGILALVYISLSGN